MTLSEAAIKGISRVRRPMWVNDRAYARIDLIGEAVGPWLHLYDRAAQNAIGEPTPQSVLNIGDTTADYVAYTGQIDVEDTGAAQ